MPFFALLASASLIVGCTTTVNNAHDSIDQAKASGQSLLTANGLLYPPELWGAIEPTTLARLSYAQLDATTAQSWDLTPQETIHAIREEMPEFTDVYVNYLVANALDRGVSMPGADQPFGISDDSLIEQWEDAPTNDLPVVGMLYIHAIAQQRDLSLPFSDAHLEAIEVAFRSDDLFQASVAFELASHFAPSQFEYADLPTNIAEPSDAPLALASLQRSGVDYDSIPHDLVEMAIANASTSDNAFVETIFALQDWGRDDDAHNLFTYFDQRRVFSPVEVLDQPQFLGSEGSTYRVLRYEEETGTKLTTEAERDIVQETLEQSKSDDPSVQLAVTGSLVYLDPDSVNHQERSAVIERASSQLQFDSGGKLELEDAFMWMSIAETAHTLDVAVTYPGLSEEAFQTLEQEEPEVVAPITAKLVLAIDTAEGSSGDADVLRLSKILEKRANGANLSDISTSEFVHLQVAYQTATSQILFPQADFKQELESREGDCRGGFSDMVRETRTPKSECSIETNRILKGNKL
ncbi:hypothetical protein [Trueperella bialowiezensis]|uniref:hypothetical protein n=1 Tax=Trueperella bialowiezensis TaxID=312285 RepID=UPI000F82F28A|nr:hypothetical protein [Trueperella bialowiezensis]